jgi:hypothetical protein
MEPGVYLEQPLPVGHQKLPRNPPPWLSGQFRYAPCSFHGCEAQGGSIDKTL